jgi:phage tail sheath protein FI
MYQHPGVYIEHVPSNALAIEAASTSVTAFIGHVRRGSPVTKSSGTPTFITSPAQYTTLFGPGDGSAGGIKNLTGSAPDLFGLAISAYFANGGAKAYIVPVQGAGGAKATAQLKISGATDVKSVAVTAKDNGSWANNLIVSMTSDKDAKTFSIAVGTWAEQPDGTKKIDQVIESFPGFDWEAGDGNAAAKLKAATDLAAATVDKGSSLISITFGADVAMPSSDKEVTDITEGGTDAAAPADAQYNEALGRLEDYRDVSIIVLPDVIPDDSGKIIYQKAIGHAEKMQNRMVIVDPGAATITTPKEAKTAVFTNSPYAALYYPRVEVSNPHFDAELSPDEPRSFAVGPAAVAAGMWARIDGTRGVWKAPAGLEAGVRGTFGPERLIGNGVQDNLNEWGVNCLRSITGPTVIWGARTTATKAKPQYRYISVRRTQNMIGESLYNALQAVVFEPNDHKLWGGLRASVGNFMDGLHRSGAFQGEKSSDAYFVNCGLGSTMTQGDIDAGIVRVAVGFAPLKPAEFVVVQISQKVGQTA